MIKKNQLVERKGKGKGKEKKRKREKEKKRKRIEKKPSLQPLYRSFFHRHKQ